MKIVDIIPYVLSTPLEEPFAFSQGRVDRRSAMVVEVRTDEGISGWGESLCHGLQPPEIAASFVESVFKPMLVGRDPFDVEVLWEEMYNRTRPFGGAVLRLLQTDLLNFLVGEDARQIEALWRRLFWATHATAVGAITSLALAAVDIALWDVRCKAAGQPLWLLAGGANSTVPLYDTEGGWLQLSTEELVLGALESKARGWPGVKLKVGKPSASEDLERLRAVREAVGPEMDIMVDANQSMTCAEAKRRARMFEEVDVFWFEEPLPAEDISGHARLAASTSIPVAVGESLYSPSHIREYLQSGGAGIIQVDAARIGGITPWLKTAHLAEAFNVKVAPHFLMELHVSLAAAVPNALYVEHIPQLRAITTEEIRIVDGHAVPPQEPGIGITWDRGTIENMRID